MSEILSQVRSIMGKNESSEISDQTINGLYEQFKSFHTDENTEDIVKRVADGCKTFRGNLMNVMSSSVDKYKTELESSKIEKQKIQEELEKLKNVPPQNINHNPVDIPDEYKTKITELDIKLSDIEKRESLLQKEKQTLDRKSRINDLVKKPENGMPIQRMVNMAISTMDFSKEYTDDIYLSKIKSAYDENAKGIYFGGVGIQDVITVSPISDDIEKQHRENMQLSFAKKFRT